LRNSPGRRCWCSPTSRTWPAPSHTTRSPRCLTSTPSRIGTGASRVAARSPARDCSTAWIGWCPTSPCAFLCWIDQINIVLYFQFKQKKYTKIAGKKHHSHQNTKQKQNMPFPKKKKKLMSIVQKRRALEPVAGRTEPEQAGKGQHCPDANG